MSGDWLWIDESTAQVSASKPYLPRVADSRIVSRTMFLEVDVALVVISPATIARPVVTSVSHATRLDRILREDGVENRSEI
jgi:hypothetical protein